MKGSNNNTEIHLVRSILDTYCVFLCSLVGNLCPFSQKPHKCLHFLVYALLGNFYNDQISERFLNPVTNPFKIIFITFD